MDLHIRDILSKFIHDKTALNEFTSPQTMDKWQRSLTHESINYKNNYENYEFLGDAVVGYGFSIYLREDLKITDSEILNNLTNYYMSKVYQPQIAKNIGLDKLIFISSEVKITDDILEDIMESFFGVIDMLSRNMKFPSKQTGPIYVRNFFRYYFTTFDRIDLKKGDQINKSLYVKFYFFLADETTQAKIGAYYNESTKTYHFNPKFIETLKYYNSDLSKEVKKVLTTRGLPNENSYIDRVIELFKSVGMDYEWYKREYEKVKFDEEIKEIAYKNDLSRFILQVNSKNSYDLLAQKTDPKTRKSISLLLHSFDTDDFIELKKQAAEIIREKYSS